MHVIIHGPPCSPLQCCPFGQDLSPPHGSPQTCSLTTAIRLSSISVACICEKRYRSNLNNIHSHLSMLKSIHRNKNLQKQSLLPSALQLASQLYIVMSEFGSTLLLAAIFLQLSQVHLALQLSPLHKQEVNQLVLIHLTFGHKPSPAEHFRVTSPFSSVI